MQPDLGSALVIASIAFAMIVVSDISYKMIMALTISFAALIAFLVYLHHHYFDTLIKIIKPHQLSSISEYRHDNWLDACNRTVPAACKLWR